MIIIGLGSNIGTPLANLREALRRLHKLNGIHIMGVSSVYLSEAQLPLNAPASWHQSYLNMAVSCTTQLSPRALLQFLQEIEISMGRNIDKTKWEPRIIDLDILIWDDINYSDEALTIPHRELFTRPFALLPLLELQPQWQHAALTSISWLNDSPTPFNTRRIKHCIDGPALMGIVNITPDSFSDGSHAIQAETCLDQIETLVHAGAEIIDLGAESTRPGATALSHEQEWQRLEPILKALTELRLDSALKPKISIDTYHARTVERALAYDIDWVNDVSGQACEAIAHHIAGSAIRYVSMHNLGIPPQALLPASCNPVHEISAWARQRLEFLSRLGFNDTQIIIDIGIGFGLSPAQTWQVLQQAGQFKQLGVPILVGHSRKSFMKAIAPTFVNRDLLTAVIANHLAQQGIDYLRVHTVDWVNQALTTQKMLNKEHFNAST